MHYRLMKNVPACDLFDGRLAEFGVREHVPDIRGAAQEHQGTTKRDRCLTDGRNYVWVYIDNNGFLLWLFKPRILWL